MIWVAIILQNCLKIVKQKFAKGNLLLSSPLFKPTAPKCTPLWHLPIGQSIDRPWMLTEEFVFCTSVSVLVLLLKILTVLQRMLCSDQDIWASNWPIYTNLLLKSHNKALLIYITHSWHLTGRNYCRILFCNFFTLKAEKQHIIFLLSNESRKFMCFL